MGQDSSQGCRHSGRKTCMERMKDETSSKRVPTSTRIVTLINHTVKNGTPHVCDMHNTKQGGHEKESWQFLPM